MKATTKTGLSVFTLAMLITVSIDSIRNLPATALFGSSLIFFFVFATVLFLIPAALVSAQLSSTWTKEGGIYHWVRMAFGEKMAFLAIWLQWINTMVWYPTILSFIAGTATFLFDPTLAQNKFYLVSVILGVFWILTLLNLKGLQTSARFASFCAVFGMIIPMALIITLAGIWVFGGRPLQLHVTTQNIIPHFAHAQSWISLTAIMTAFLGMELATVHIRNIKNAQHKFPKALFWSVLIITITMLCGSLAIAFVLPVAKIHLVDGVMQAFVNFFTVYHLKWMIPVIAIALLIGSLGGMINWVISPAKGLLQAAEKGYLPKFFQKENKHQVPSHLLLTQALLVSAVCSAFLLMPSVNGSYWLLTDLSTQLYMVMYVLMFLAAIAIFYKYSDHPKTFTIPGGKVGYWITCLFGIIGCSITIVVGFFPPSGINVGGPV
ncbi:MAG: amino acid permease, partial [Coxiellaceae bacterium]|nr:amino acid permease [Coxiellaceae bacterium]